MLADAHSAQFHSIDFDAGEPPALPADLAAPRQETSIENDGADFAQVDEVIGRSGINGTALSAAGGYTPGQSQASTTEDQRQSEDSIFGPNARADLADEMRAATFVSFREGRSAEQGQSTERHAEESGSAGTTNARLYSREIAARTDQKNSVNRQNAGGNQQQDAKAELADIRFVARSALDAGSGNNAGTRAAPVPVPVDKNRSVASGAVERDLSRQRAAAANVAKPAHSPGIQRPVKSALERPLPTQLMPAQLITRQRDAVHSSVPRKSPDRTPQTPRVHIGQIDVVVESATSVKRRAASPPAASDLASRHYLRNL